MKLLNHWYAERMSLPAMTMATTMERIPMPREMNCAMRVCFFISIAGLRTDWMSRTQLVATELMPVERVDCAAAKRAARRIPVRPAGSSYVM